jgi:hypothetical protein
LAFDTYEQRLGMLGFGGGDMLPESSVGDFNDLEAQIFLGLPGQNEQGVTEAASGGYQSRLALGLGLGLGI